MDFIQPNEYLEVYYKLMRTSENLLMSIIDHNSLQCIHLTEREGLQLPSSLLHTDSPNDLQSCNLICIM